MLPGSPGPGFQLVEVIRPGLHHLAAFGLVSDALVGASVRVYSGVSQLVPDQVGAEARHLVQYRTGRKSWPLISSLAIPRRRMAARMALSLMRLAAAGAGENVAPVTRQGLRFPQDRHGLMRQREDMGIAFLGCDVTPRWHPGQYPPTVRCAIHRGTRISGNPAGQVPVFSLVRLLHINRQNLHSAYMG